MKEPRTRTARRVVELARQHPDWSGYKLAKEAGCTQDTARRWKAYAEADGDASPAADDGAPESPSVVHEDGARSFKEDFPGKPRARKRARKTTQADAREDAQETDDEVRESRVRDDADDDEGGDDGPRHIIF